MTMSRFEFLETLRKALDGLPQEVIDKTVADYEKRIHDASAAGQPEDDILASLGDPQAAADAVRAGLAPKPPVVITQPAPRMAPPPASNGPTRAARGVFSLIGLMVFNVFLILPALAYAGLLVAAFAVSLACYGGGIVLTGASLSGVTELSLNEPFHHVHVGRPVHLASNDDHTLVKIGPAGIHVETGDGVLHVEPSSGAGGAASGSASVPAAAANAASASASASTSSDSTKPDHDTSIDIGPNGIVIKDGDKTSTLGKGENENVDIDVPGLHVHGNNVNVDDDEYDDSSISLGEDLISESRPVQVSVGIALIVGGIIGFLLSLVILRYTVLGIGKLAQMEFGVLRGV